MLSLSPLFSLTRGGHEEVCVLGELVLSTGDAVHRSGESGSRFPARSLLKPFQFLATGLAAGDGELPAERIPALGSISATAAQVDALRRWHASEPGSGEASSLVPHLHLPSSWPMSVEHRAHLVESGGSPSNLYLPCFSKHLAILAACRLHGWPLAGYTQPHHPYHQRLLTMLEAQLGRAGASIEFVTDGCHLGTPLLSALELAELYRALAAAPDGSELGRLRRAMAAQPGWIGGPDRVDSRLMQRNPGRLIAKEGADGLLAIGVHPSREAPAGAGLIVKLASGHQPAWAALAAAPFLEALGLEPLLEPTPGQDVQWHVRPGHGRGGVLDISPVLSERIAVWPGDTAFRRTPVSEPGSAAGSAPGWELLVSSIHTTLHVGAHADAPNHFEPGQVGIDRVPLHAYRGPCEVVVVEAPRGGVIEPSHLGRAARAPRLLFRTGSFPNPDRFDADFVAFAPELIEWLLAAGVILIGIDTPSVDPFASKTLPSHHATRRGPGMAILEGLDLSGVSPGLYELVALPLRLEGADASPVRATLWPLR
jgi:arylformamidase